MNNFDFPTFVFCVIMGFIGLLLGYGIDRKHILETQQAMIKNNIGEYRINKQTGETSFHMFKVESGKIVE